MKSTGAANVLERMAGAARFGSTTFSPGADEAGDAVNAIVDGAGETEAWAAVVAGEGC